MELLCYGGVLLMMELLCSGGFLPVVELMCMPTVSPTLLKIAHFLRGKKKILKYEIMSNGMSGLKK